MALLCADLSYAILSRRFLTTGESAILPLLTSQCKSQALCTGRPVTTAPRPPHCLPARVRNLGTVTGHQPRQIGDSLGVCVCVGYCGEGCSAYDSLMLLVVLSRFSTADRTWPRSGRGCFCSGHSPFWAPPLAVAELRSLAPRRRHVLWSGSPWAGVHHESV